MTTCTPCRLRMSLRQRTLERVARASQRSASERTVVEVKRVDLAIMVACWFIAMDTPTLQER